jgi:WD40 repeat protein
MSSDLVCFSQTVICVVALSDGRRVVSGSSDNTLRVWDVDTGECVRELQGHGWVSEC